MFRVGKLDTRPPLAGLYAAAWADAACDLAGASGRFGPIAEAHITQRGVAIAPLVQPYQLLNHPNLAALRG